jgi:SAM-dependent methyltransferase
MSLPPIFTPAYYAHWRDFEARHWWTAGMRDVASMLLDLAELSPEGVLLDVGCGSGQGMRWFATLRSGWRTFGVDPSLEGLRAAMNAGFSAIVAGSGTALPLVSAVVDLVISLDVIQHLPLDGGDRRTLSEMQRVLKPGGHLFIRTNAQGYPRVPDDVDAVWHKYDPDELAAKLKDAGFTVLRLSRINALLGLAEVLGEVRSGRAGHRHSSYDVVAAPVPEAGGWTTTLKRGWLRLEGRAVRAGLRLPLGRSLVALCRRD